MRTDFKERHKDNFWHEITSFGGYVFPFLVFLTFLALGNYDFAKKYFIGIILIYIVAFALRLIFFKPRPDKFKYDNFLEKLDASSFPSLHAARATFVFLMLSDFMQNTYFSILAAVLVLLTCYSRIRFKRHDWKDV